MDMTEMVIEVNGLPDNYPKSTMIDKLTMHFLRRSNGGGEVLSVIYPTTNKGQAYVVFESANVPGVLEHTHVLELDRYFYPLEVKKMHEPKLDMPAEAFLDMNMFSSQRKIQELLHSHGFKVSETSPGQLRLQGSFLKLKLIYSKLMPFLVLETHPQRRTSLYTNGYSSDTVSSDYESRSNLTSRHSRHNDNSVHAGIRSTRSPESPNRPALLQSAHLLEGSSSTETSPSRSYEDSHTSVRQRNPSSLREKTGSFFVDPETWEYINHFKRNKIESITSFYNTKISHQKNSEFYTVNITGGSIGEVTEKLTKLVKEISVILCTQVIDRKKVDYNLVKQIDTFQDIYSVLIMQEGDMIKVVGSSRNSYEVKQKLLGLQVDTSPAKPFERTGLRRSSSLPRQRSKASMENRDNLDTMNATPVSSSSAPHSQTGSQPQQEVQKERGRPSSRSPSHHGRSLSSSRIQHKTPNRANQEPPPNDQHDLTPSSQKPKMKTALVTDKFFAKKINKLLYPKRKSTDL